MSRPLRPFAEAALSVARERGEHVRRMRAALVRGDDVEALRWARIVAGLEEAPDAESDRAPARQ